MPTDTAEADAAPPVPRRRWLTQPGESLLLSSSPMQLAVRFQEFADWSGIAERDLTVTPLSAIPLPIYPAAGAGRRWIGTRPETIWHPLLWLPEDLAAPDPARNESTPAWVVRLCLTLEVSGVYHPDDGWVDVLAACGLPADDEANVSRVEHWLAGGSDPVLDHIDLAGFFETGRGVDWAYDFAAENLDTLEDAAIAITASDLLAAVEGLLDTDAPPVDTAESRDTLETVLLLADVQLPFPEQTTGDGDPLSWTILLERFRDRSSSSWSTAAAASAAFDDLKRQSWAGIERLQQLEDQR